MNVPAVVVKPADPALRRAVLKGASGNPGGQAQGKPRKRRGGQAAVITGFRDGTFSVRLLGFDRVALEAVKAAPTRRLRWDDSNREWLGWSPADRERVHERLESIGYSVALRGAA